MGTMMRAGILPALNRVGTAAGTTDKLGYQLASGGGLTTRLPRGVKQSLGRV
jgi:hypothetical protein